MTRVIVKKDWLHECGRREYTADAAFEVVESYTRMGWRFYDIIVPWQEKPWTVIEWRVNGRPFSVDEIVL